MEKTIYSDEYGCLLRWLRESREQKNWTMRDLAKELNVHHSWIGRVELGERRLDVMEFFRYCIALEVDPHDGLEKLRGRG